MPSPVANSYPMRIWHKYLRCDNCGKNLHPEFPISVILYGPHYDNPKLVCEKCAVTIRKLERNATYGKVATSKRTRPQTKTPTRCRVCGGEGEHDWEVHNAELRSDASTY